MTREQLEDLCKDLFNRIRNPVDQALKSSGLSMDVISQVITPKFSHFDTMIFSCLFNHDSL